MNKIIRAIVYWYWLKKLHIKYGIGLRIYTFIFPRKFKDDEHVLYSGVVWRIYYCQKSFKPYYYHLYRESKTRYIYTGIAEEGDLKRLPPVLKELYGV